MVVRLPAGDITILQYNFVVAKRLVYINCCSHFALNGILVGIFWTLSMFKLRQNIMLPRLKLVSSLFLLMIKINRKTSILLQRTVDNFHLILIID